MMDTMPSFWYSCVVLFVWTAFQPSTSSDCDRECTDKPVFTPSSLVVKYGDALSATCTACESECMEFNVEKAIGVNNKNETAKTVVWTVHKMTEWGASVLCYYNHNVKDDHQCCTDLNVTVYQPPSRVPISVVNHTGPMLEGQQYTLQCAVQQAAPIGKVQVVFYKGQTKLASMRSNSRGELKKPQDETFTLDFTPSKEDDGDSFRCEVSLDLDIPQPRPVVTSANMTVPVHYKPEVDPLSSEVIFISAGDPLHLSCWAKGNPTPTYHWTHPSHVPDPPHSGNFTIKSASSSDGGQYTCFVSNSMGNVTITFQVQVQATNIIVPVVAVVLLFTVIVIVIVIVIVRRKN
ncbi:vascular cell adhesion protein 1-like [Nelusetta ayraudi]|uniref:vascular cell adhesion protein 1-like n=1 Tax=Nelusetta ayraudi TaxID=303726 RepID=UPI003F6E7C54